MGRKVYKNNKYNNRKAKMNKKTKRNVVIATVFGSIVICLANIIPVKADVDKDSKDIYIETVNTDDGVDFKNVDYPVDDNNVVNDAIEVKDPFNVGSSLDKNKVIDFLNSKDGKLIYKYSSDYGVDPNIMASIAMQETTLNHEACIPGGEWYSGYGVGLMQLESPTGEEVSAFNYNTNDWDTEYITMDNACNKDTNIKIGCMLFQNKIKENCGNVCLSIQSHNYGQGMIDMMMNKLYGDKAREVKMDYGNTSWITEIENIHNNPGIYLSDWNESGYGDGQYLNHVLRFCPTDEVKYKYGAYEYTFNLKTMQVTDMFEYGTSIKK